MGLLAKIFTGKVAAKVVNRAIARNEARRAAAGAAATGTAAGRAAGAGKAGEYIPAGEVVSARAGHGALLERATQVYRRNPKLIAGIATVAAAAVLAGMKRKPH